MKKIFTTVTINGKPVKYEVCTQFRFVGMVESPVIDGRYEILECPEQTEHCVVLKELYPPNNLKATMPDENKIELVFENVSHAGFKPAFEWAINRTIQDHREAYDASREVQKAEREAQRAEEERQKEEARREREREQAERAKQKAKEDAQKAKEKAKRINEKARAEIAANRKKNDKAATVKVQTAKVAVNGNHKNGKLDDNDIRNMFKNRKVAVK